MPPLLAIDPGTTQSAMVRWNGRTVESAVIVSNDAMLTVLRSATNDITVAVEMIAAMGMPVGKEVFETCLVIGRIQEIFAGRKISCRLVYRRDVKLHHCQTARAKDSNVAQALRDKYGGKGTKANPGRTYLLKSHLWQAFAVATFVTETAGVQI